MHLDFIYKIYWLVLQIYRNLEDTAGMELSIQKSAKSVIVGHWLVNFLFVLF